MTNQNVKNKHVVRSVRTPVGAPHTVPEWLLALKDKSRYEFTQPEAYNGSSKKIKEQGDTAVPALLGEADVILINV